MNASVVYKYRALRGIVEYKVLSGEFGVDSTLHLQDTSCTHAGPKCEIEVEMCENGNCYRFSKALNYTAEEYSYFHTLEKFWATKEEAYIEYLQMSIESSIKNIADDKRIIKADEEKLSGLQKKDAQYFTSKMAKLGSTCYIEQVGICKIIGTILFENGKTGYLTDECYNDYGDTTDRIILIETDNGEIKSERGDSVYISKQDFDNFKSNNEIRSLTKDINNYKNRIERLERDIKLCESIIESKDSLTYEQMNEMRYCPKK